MGPAPSTLTVRGAYSRSRMLDLFRSQPALNGAGTGAFNGLRVRMGVATGIVEGPAESSSALANIMNSSLYKLAVGEWCLDQYSTGVLCAVCCQFLACCACRC